MPRKLYRHTRRPASRMIKAESRAHKLHTQNRLRLKMVKLCLGVSYAILAVRLIEVGLIGGGDLPFKRLVAEPHLLLELQERHDGVLPASEEQRLPRGVITDRNGVLLAANVPTTCLAANPQLIRQPVKVASALASVLHDVKADALAKKLQEPNSRFTYVKRQLTPSEQEAVHQLGVPGLFFEQSQKRIYPMGALTAHILGAVDIDQKGVAGVERFFDKRLRYGGADTRSLALSIDMRVQSVVAEEVQRAMQEFSAIGAAALVMDVQSGEMLSMVSLPSYDPHHIGQADKEALFNRVSLGTYEPGSTFKTFTLALALEKGVVSVNGGYDTSRTIYEAGHTIKDHKPFYRWMSVPEIFAFSSNIGTVRMLQDAGFAAQKNFLETLGFTQPVAIELPERGNPIVPHRWTPLQHMTASYGHGISVTPLHLARAMSAMVNGGFMPKLTLRKRSSEQVRSRKRVIRASTSRQVRDMMRLVVNYGTARQAQVAGYAVGGKTGTAEKSINGRYEDDKKITSFISAFPIHDPKYLVFVMVDEPKGNKQTFGYATGGWVAAPAVSRIIERIGPLLGVMPTFDLPDSREVEFWEASRSRNKEARQAYYRRRNGGLHAAAY